MAILSRRIKVFSNGSYQVETPGGYPNLYRHKDDYEIWGMARDCAPCPAVFPLLPNSDHKVDLTEQWQYYIRAINWGMELTHVSGLFGPKKAFTNRDPGIVVRDYLERKDLNSPNLPQQDRVRSCSRSPILADIRDGVAVIRTMDGTKPPPLKPGYSYPTHVNEINPDAYLYHPKTHWGMFLVATNTVIDAEGRILTRPFPNGAVYDWIGDGQPYVFWPYISNREIVYSLGNLVKIDSVQTPYTK